MKFNIFFVCCFLITMHYSVEAGLVKDFFGKVKETAEVIHKDVKQVWRPDNANKDNNEHGDGSVTPSTVVPKAEEGKPVEKEDSKVPEKVSFPDEKKSEEPIVSPTPVTATVDKDAKQEESTTVTSTTTEKEGRENFSGGCQTGYKRTADGRCMSTF